MISPFWLCFRLRYSSAHNRVSRAGCSAVSKWLGAASYPVYVLHVPSLILYERYAAQFGLSAQANLSYVLPSIFLLTLVVIALILDHYYDQPGSDQIARRRRFGTIAL